jgi:predicted  nucleic acid-binding Zn-ribbon protein
MAYLPILFRIQEIHNRQRILRKYIQETEQRPDLIELRNRKAEYSKKLATIDKKQGVIRKSIDQLDLDLKFYIAKIQQEETKLYDGSVMNSRELEQLQLKIMEYSKLKVQLEEDIFQLLEEEEKLTNLKERVETAQQNSVQQLGKVEKVVKERIFELKLESSELKSELEELMSRVPKEWFDRLGKIADSHNGIGIAQIKSGCCGACHVSLSESLLQMAKRGEDRILLCENCGRIIFY